MPHGGEEAGEGCERPDTVGPGESGEARAQAPPATSASHFRQPLPPQLLSFHSQAHVVSSKFKKKKKSVNITLQRTILTQKTPGRLSGERGRNSH